MKLKYLKQIGLLTGITAALFFYLFFDFGEGGTDIRLMASIAVLMSLWWMTEAIPLAATSLVPLILFPLTGILSGSETATEYINSTIFLFMGGFLIAIAMERWNLHRRLAMKLITVFGTKPSGIILGFMIASAFLSMWASNTATAIMLLPIGLAILGKLEDNFGITNTKNFSIALLLGIAYSCSIGGIATLIGTPPNLVFQRIYSISFPENPEIVFGEWILFGLPLSIFMLFIVWILLTKVIYKPEKGIHINEEVIEEERAKLGKISFEEKAVLIIFISTAVLWIFRVDLNIGLLTIPGWSALVPYAKYVDDGTVAVGMAFLLFIIPAKNKKGNGYALLDVTAFRKIPWEIILLFGGGFALAAGFVKSGLSDYIGAQLGALGNIPVILLIAVICFTITFLTELTSNTATAQIVLPILASLAVYLQINPLLLMIPATISSSMAFMMPVATPPNAIVFSSQRIKVYHMAKSGIILNLIGTMVITLYVYFYFG